MAQGAALRDNPTSTVGFVGTALTVPTDQRRGRCVARLLAIPGVGLLTAAAVRARLGDVRRFPSGRHVVGQN